MPTLNIINIQARAGENGSALVYILIAIALLAALTVSFMQPSSQQTSSQNTFKTISGLDSQVNTIRSAIQECLLSYPEGDTTINDGTITDPGARTNYPINPDSEHFTTATPGRSGDRLVRNIRCPGKNSGNVEDHELLFSAKTGRFMPTPPALFGDWQYYNGDDGVFIWIETNKTDAFLASALEKGDTKYAECEADVVDATSSAKDLDRDGDVSCTSGSYCFRIRMFSNDSAIFNGDTDDDEDDANCDVSGI